VTLWQAACSNPPSGRAGSGVSAFVRLIDGLGPATAGLPLPEIVEHVVNASGLIEYYQKERDGQERIDNLRELVAAADLFEREAATGGPSIDDTGAAADTLTAFLAHAALEAGDTQAAEGRAALQLMTVHTAKGLEFHTVFITGLEEGLFPHDNSLNDLDGPEEERRLMYVALTRARRRLYLTYAQSRSLHGQVRYNVPSRFVDEIPKALTRWLSARPSNLMAEPARYRDDFDAPTRPPRETESAAPAFRIGQNVIHAKFGSGVIVNAEGRGTDARVQVNFRDAGLKWLSLEFAKLEAA
jgi:DNA helicase-2/ATP-dependent DNA helicase PcrA